MNFLKKFLFFGACAIIILSGCTFPNDKKSEQDQAINVPTPPAEVIREYVGTMNDGKIKFTMNLRFFDSYKIDGTYSYSTQNKKINVTGTKLKKGLTLEENIVGQKARFEFYKEEFGAFRGTWQSGEKKFPVEMEEVYNNLPEGKNITGHYDDGGQTLDILLLNPGQVKFQGEAFWMGANPDNIHTGNVQGVAQLNADNTLENYDADMDCLIKMKFSLNEKGAPMINAEDNLQCGGANVTFNGDYIRKDTRIKDWTIFNSNRF